MSIFRDLDFASHESMMVGRGLHAQPLRNSHPEQCNYGSARVNTDIIFRTVSYSGEILPKNSGPKVSPSAGGCVLRKSGDDPGKEMHSVPSFFPAIATFLLCCSLSFYYSLSSLSWCFPALQVGGIHVLFCPIDEQKVVKHLLLLALSLGQRLCIKFSDSSANFLTTLRSHLDLSGSFWSSLFNVDDESLHALDK
jgi:hypothetical protein